MTIERGDLREEHRSGDTAGVVVHDTLVCGEDSEAVLACGNQVHLLGPGARLTADEPAGKEGRELGQVRLLHGTATFFLPRSEEKKYKFQALSHAVLAAVRGTVFRMDVLEPGAEVTVIKGQVDLFKMETAGSPGLVPTEGLLMLGTLAEGHRGTTDNGTLVDTAVSPADMSRIKEDLFLRKEVLRIDLATF